MLTCSPVLTFTGFVHRTCRRSDKISGLFCFYVDQNSVLLLVTFLNFTPASSDNQLIKHFDIDLALFLNQTSAFLFVAYFYLFLT